MEFYDFRGLLHPLFFKPCLTSFTNCMRCLQVCGNLSWGGGLSEPWGRSTMDCLLIFLYSWCVKLCMLCFQGRSMYHICKLPKKCTLVFCCEVVVLNSSRFWAKVFGSTRILGFLVHCDLSRLVNWNLLKGLLIEWKTAFLGCFLYFRIPVTEICHLSKVRSQVRWIYSSLHRRQNTKGSSFIWNGDVNPSLLH